MTNWRLVVANGLLLLGISALVSVGTETAAIELLPHVDGEDGVADLEQLAATAPSPAVISALATIYLDRRQPGLSIALIDRAPASVQNAPEVGIVEAKAAFAMGEPERALALVTELDDRCGTETCPQWVAIKASLHREFLEEVVASGIADPGREPVATLAAYRRSAREVRLAMQ